MKKFGIKVDILPYNYFIKEDGTFNKEEALLLSGKFAGVCYDKEGFNHLVDEPLEKTQKRVKSTLENGHHSVYDHIFISFNMQNIPKILAMVLNNEHQYTTSEKSARYTPVVKKDDGIISDREEELYNKWVEIFKEKINKRYEGVYNDFRVKTLAQENARYLVTVFMPTQMIYTTTLRQINYLVSFMNSFIEDVKNNGKSDFYQKLASAMQELCDELKRLNVTVDGLTRNEKNRKVSLFGKDIKSKKEYFGDIYLTTYKGTYAYLAQAQRHRTLQYEMEILDKKEYFIPPIIKDDEKLVEDWLQDIKSLSDIYPIGELILIKESGKYEDFILKCKERLCSAAQLEIMYQTKDTLFKYHKSLKEDNNPLHKDIEKYTHGARCTFPDFECPSRCNFKEGINNTREI